MHAGRYSSGQRGQTVNLLAIAYGGSNPSLPILSSIHTRQRAGVAQLVEHWPSKPIVAGSSPVSRFVASCCREANVKQLIGEMQEMAELA